MNLVKGSRIKARWFAANNPPSSLAGMQMKFGVTEHVIEGVVTHIRGDAPVNPTKLEVIVRPDGEETEVALKPEWIVEVQP